MDTVASFLSGEPQNAYFDISVQDARQYPKLKAEVLARLGATPSIRAQWTDTWTFHLDNKWLQPGVSTACQVIEKVVLDRFF